LKKGLLFVLSALVLLLAGISIYINLERQPVKVRIINLSNEWLTLQARIDDWELPYTISYGTSSEYITVDNRRTAIDLIVITLDSHELAFNNIPLAPDSLNTLVLYSANPDHYYRLNTPASVPRNRTALRFIPDPLVQRDIQLSQINEEIQHNFSSTEEEQGEYKLLTEDYYNLKIIEDGKETQFRVFLEKGEYYTLVIISSVDSYEPKPRLFVDNLPGDQYVIPTSKTIR